MVPDEPYYIGFARTDSESDTPEGHSNHHINTRLYYICLSFILLMVFRLARRKILLTSEKLQPI